MIPRFDLAFELPDGALLSSPPRWPQRKFAVFPKDTNVWLRLQAATQEPPTHTGNSDQTRSNQTSEQEQLFAALTVGPDRPGSKLSLRPARDAGGRRGGKEEKSQREKICNL